MDHKPQEDTQGDKPSEDYPMGGSLEPYDIWRDMQILENIGRIAGQIK
ncbi:MAG: hypothetical protein V1867_00910 [Candidatus Falkowbacteria bacterium]